MRRSAVSQIVVIFLSCWLVICQGIVIWDGQTNDAESILQDQRAGGTLTIRPLGPTAMISVGPTLTAFKFQFQVFWSDTFLDGAFCSDVFAASPS